MRIYVHIFEWLALALFVRFHFSYFVSDLKLLFYESVYKNRINVIDFLSLFHFQWHEK